MPVNCVCIQSEAADKKVINQSIRCDAAAVCVFVVVVVVLTKTSFVLKKKFRHLHKKL